MNHVPPKDINSNPRLVNVTFLEKKKKEMLPYFQMYKLRIWRWGDYVGGPYMSACLYARETKGVLLGTQERCEDGGRDGADARTSRDTKTAPRS